MSQDCEHGKQHLYHQHFHVGVAEGLSRFYVQKLQIVLILTCLYLLAQILGSLASGSLALMAEAGHKLADVGAISLALVAAWFSRLPHPKHKTFGYDRLEILAAMMNGILLFGMGLFILYEAYGRATESGHLEIEGGIMFGVALVGLLINLVAARILYPVQALNLNVKGALLHIMADVLNSIGTLLAAIAIVQWNFTWLDIVLSVAIAALILYNAGRVFWEAFNILMESAPRHLNVSEIRDFLLSQAGVRDVHDLHVWTITTGKEALLAHVQVDAQAFGHETIRQLEQSLRERFALCHITLQLEPVGFEEDEIACERVGGC